MEAYLEHSRVHGHSRQTVYHRGWVLRRCWLPFCRGQGLEAPGDLQGWHLELYQQALEQRGLQPHTRLQSVRSFLRWAARSGHLLLDPTRDWMLPNPQRAELRVLRYAEVEALLEAPDLSTSRGLRDQAVLELLYGTGLRLGEAHRLDLADLDLGARALLVREGKGGRDRWCPVGESLAESLERYLVGARPLLGGEDSEALFLCTRFQGSRLKPWVIRERIREYGRALGLDFPPHALRHSFATHLLENGASLGEVQAVLGHALARSTERYTRVSAEDLRQMHRRCHPRARRRMP